MTTAMPPVRGGLEWLVQRIADRTGLDFSGPHHDRMVDTIARMARGAAASYEAYAARLERDPTALEALVDHLTVGETYFFREPEHFTLLRDVIVPSAYDASANPALRVWSAGCASGEEPYSVAITLDELGVLHRSEIVGTDLSAHALARARAAEYRRWSLRRCTEPEREAWFTQEGDTFRLDERYARAVRYRSLNLLEGPPAGHFHVVLCRNVLIYLTAEGIAAATAALHDALAPGGWLLVGASDPPLEHRGLHRVAGRHGIAYRRTDDRRCSAPQSPREARREVRHRSRRRRDAAPPRPSVERQTLQVQHLLHAPQGAGHAAVIRRLGARGALDDARRAADAAITAHPLDAELRCLLATVHLHAGRPDDAANAAAAAVYLDPAMVVAHLVLAHARRQAGREDLAQRSFRNAMRLLTPMPPDAEVPLADGELAGPLAAVVARELRPGERGRLR